MGGPRAGVLALAVALAGCGGAGRSDEGASPETARHPFFAGATWLGRDAPEVHAAALQAMGEPSLAGPGRRALRLLWLRTFHRPLAVRLVLTDSSCRVVLSVLEGKGTPPFGVVRRRDSSTTAASRCAEVVNALDAAAFWSDTLRAATQGRDGADWVFEAHDSTAYRVVVRWTPEVARDPRFAQAGRAFLRLAGFDEAADDPIY